MGFETNVFINCPFDEDYKPLLKSLLFTIIYFGLDPHLSETTDSGRTRIQGIETLIENSKYSVHDRSGEPSFQNRGPKGRRFSPLQSQRRTACR